MEPILGLTPPHVSVWIAYLLLFFFFLITKNPTWQGSIYPNSQGSKLQVVWSCPSTLHHLNNKEAQTKSQRSLLQRYTQGAYNSYFQIHSYYPLTSYSSHRSIHAVHLHACHGPQQPPAPLHTPTQAQNKDSPVHYCADNFNNLEYTWDIIIVNSFIETSDNREWAISLNKI